jgi:hypothetical protein
MTKHLYRLAHLLQESLRQGAGSPPSKDWVQSVPRMYLNAWSALFLWDQIGKPITRITDEQEAALLEGLPPDLDLASAPLFHSALAIQMPERKYWFVIARHDAQAPIFVAQDQMWTFPASMITYASNCCDGDLMSGYINLRDRPTPSHLQLIPGFALSSDGTYHSLAEAEIAEHDYRLALALSALYRGAFPWPKNS